jgi:uncharacterized protein YggE
MPTARDAMKQPDAIEGQGESEIRFHLPQTIIPAWQAGVRPDHVLVLQQLLAEGKKNTLRESNRPLAMARAWCTLARRTALHQGRGWKDKTMRHVFRPVTVTLIAAAALLVVPFAGAGGPGQAGFLAATAQTAETPRQISVSGTGRVDLPPDMAMVRIGVTHQNEDAGAAMQQTSDAVALMLERLAGLGIAARDVQTASLSLNPVWRDRPDQQGQPVPWGFEASNVVSLRLRDITMVGDVLDALVADGANRLDGLSFGLQDPEAAMDEARRLAVADARRKAALYAEAAGVGLGQVISLSEAGGGMPRPQMMEMAAMRADSVPVAAGELGVTATVQMMFALE